MFAPGTDPGPSFFELLRRTSPEALPGGNLPAAMQGLVVVPLFGGYDLRKGEGRLYKYDVTGGKYEEADYATTGSGSVHARNWIKAGYRAGMTRDEIVDLGLLALFQAA